MLYALCAVVAMQKYVWLEQFDYPTTSHFYTLRSWHGVAEVFMNAALECLSAHQTDKQGAK